MQQPLVSVIITCYNHAAFVEKAVQSVISQTHSNCEIILIDDCSTDNSKSVIIELQQKHTSLKVIFNSQNLGFCKTFNKAFFISNGEFIVDLAADDILLPNKISTQLERFNELPKDYGVVYSDLVFINEKGNPIPDYRKKAIFPEGDIHSLLIEKHIIYASTLLIKRSVLTELNGFNEDLSFEDFDFFVRASRNWKVGCVPTPLMAKRELPTSLGKKVQHKNNSLTDSTLKICKNIKQNTRNNTERKALRKRVIYEAKEAFDYKNYTMALAFLKELFVI